MKIEIKIKYNMYSNYKNYRKGEVLIIDSNNNFPKGSYDIVRQIDNDIQGYDNKMMTNKNINKKNKSK